MNKALTAGLATIIVFAVAPAIAGAPNNPGEQGDFVNHSREYWQGKNGESGWGQRVSDKANGSTPNSYRNLGDYVNSRSEGPNPTEDSGGGND